MKKVLGIVSCGLFMSVCSQAHVRQRTYVSGQESIIAWPDTASIKIQMHSFSGNVGGGATATSLDFTAARALAGSAIAQWSGAGVTLFAGLVPKFTLDLSGGLPYTTANNCETTTDGNIDGVNNLVFTKKIDTSCAVSLIPTAGVIGLTKVAFRQSNGEIVEADIQFDDSEFLFKSSGTNNLTASPKEIVLKDVMVHELGHFFGLDHSPVREAAMLFAIAENLQTTKTDDQMGMFSLYPPSGLSSSTGVLQGSVKNQAGDPVFGAVVFLLNARTLKIEASEMSDLNGAFQFCALPPGPHVAYVSSYRPYGTNIHEYYSGDGADGSQLSDGTCYNPGCVLMTKVLEPTWYTKASSAGAVGGKSLKIVPVNVGVTNQYLNITGEEVTPTVDDVGTGNVLTLDEPRLARLSQSTLPLSGQATNIGTHTYDFIAPASGNVQIRTAALGIYARLKLRVDLLDAGMTTDYTSSLCPVSTGSGEAFDEPSTGNPSTDIANARDPWLNCTGLTSGTHYTVRVTGTGLSCREVPGNKQSCESVGESSSTPIPYYLLTAFETSKLDDTTLSEELDVVSAATTTFGSLPTCGVRSATVSGAKDVSPSDGEKKNGSCCGILQHHVPGGPSGPASFLLALVLNPLTWFALYWASRTARLKTFKAIR